MRGDLISRSRMVEYIRKMSKISYEDTLVVKFREIIDCVNSQPTAYDVDEVVQNLTELQLRIKDKSLAVEDEEYAVMLRGQLRGIADCLEIIKSGGGSNGK